MVFLQRKQLFRSILLSGIAVLLFMSVPCASSSAGMPKPQASIDEFLNTLRSMEFPVTNEAAHAEKITKADAFLDLDALGRKSIAAYWQQATAAEKVKFQDLFIRLIERVAYQKSNEFLADFDVSYPSQENDETGVLVTSIVEQQDESLNAEVIYHLYQKEDHWVIDDVILDGVSIVEDLQYQFEKLIKENGFDGLFEKMESRLDEAAMESAGSYS